MRRITSRKTFPLRPEPESLSLLILKPPHASRRSQMRTRRLHSKDASNVPDMSLAMLKMFHRSQAFKKLVIRQDVHELGSN